jgi:2-(1,2-epoxy-1,2-dihydrophenyl)acetyl-CoA isomerase
MIVAQANGQVGGLVIERGDDGVVVVRLNRPERRNMIDTVTAQQLTTLFIAANTDSSIRSFLITGVADVYCTGADAVSAADTPTPGTLDYRYATEDFRRLFQAMWEVEKPVVTAVNGTVAGAGWMFALLGDLVVADSVARWTHVFTRRGMVPHAGDPYFLARIIPFHRLNEIALLSDTMTSVNLHAWGLVNRCVPATEVFSTALELAQRLAAGPTRTLGFTKRLYRRSLSSDMATAFEDERNATALISTTADRREGVLSFIEKRSPHFIGN